jgi:SnoaL-like domain
MSAKTNISHTQSRLEDIEAIKILKARYGYYCDDSYDPAGISSLFVENGVWDGGQFGRYEGRQAIHDFFRDLARDKIGFAMHLFMNPLIEVSCDTAKGHWYLLCPLTLHEGNQATWCAGRYFEEYVKVDGEWKYKLLRFTHTSLLPLTRDGLKRNFYFEQIDS